MDKKMFRHKIMVSIVEGFNSNPSTRETHISTHKLYPEYFTGLGDLDFVAFAAFGEAVEEGISEGFWRATRDDKCNVYKTIIATKEQAERLASILQLVSRDLYMGCVRDVLSRYTASSCPQVRNWVIRELGECNFKQVSQFYKYYNKIDLCDLEWKLTTLLSGCETIYHLTDDVLCRNLSVKMGYGSSKEFENSYMEKTAKILAPDLSTKDIKAREILKAFHVLENPASVWIKGHGQVWFAGGDKISLIPNGDSIAFSRSYVEHITKVSGVETVLSIENLTTFNCYMPNQGEVVVFTSGYANSLVVKFLQLCKELGCVRRFFHFGDLDAYGFDILRNLSVRSGVKISPYLMDVKTYELNKDRAIEMTKGNCKLLKAQCEMDWFSDESKALFRLLLAEGKTLEQEGILEV